MKTIHNKLTILIILLVSNIYMVHAQEEHAPGQTGEVRQVTVRLPNIPAPQTLKVEVIDGLAILEGDIILGPISSLSTGRGGATTTSVSVRWTNGVIPYVIPAGHTTDSLAVIQAINEMNSQTNLTLRPRNSETDYVEFNLGGSGYSSHIGKIGGKQTINVASSHIKGKIMHEIGHAAGLFHEHTRQDRDTHVTIDTMNVIQGKRHNFRKYTSHWNYGNTGGTDHGGYDYGSIMHYPRFSSFAIDSSIPIITTIPPGTAIGQRTALSAGDIQAINSIYPSASSGSGSSTSGTGSGSSTTTGTGSPDETGAAIDISYQVELIPQTTAVSCWAASAAMIVAWRESENTQTSFSINPEDIARQVGGWRQLFNNQGLPPDNTEMFDVWGLRYEYPQSYTVEGFAQLMRMGPLWVATDLNNGAHVVVVSAMRGDGTPEGTILSIHDPWEEGMTSFRPSNQGSTYEETYREFVERQERLAHAELSEPTAFYIAY